MVTPGRLREEGLRLKRSLRGVRQHRTAVSSLRRYEEEVGEMKQASSSWSEREQYGPKQSR